MDGPAFIPSSKFEGARPGYAFKIDEQGLGYYWDPISAKKYVDSGEKIGVLIPSAYGAGPDGGADGEGAVEGDVEVGDRGGPYNKFASDGSYFSKICQFLAAQKRGRSWSLFLEEVFFLSS